MPGTIIPNISRTVLWVGWAHLARPHVGGRLLCGCSQTTGRTRVIQRLSGAECSKCSLPWLAGHTGFGWELISGLHMASSHVSSFLTAWQMDSKSGCSNRREVEAANLLRPESRNRHSVTSSIFYWSESHRAQIKKEETQISYFSGRNIKEFLAILKSPPILNASRNKTK